MFLLLLGAVWLVVLLSDGFGLIFLDQEFFAFREWEVVTDKGAPPGPFRSNYVFEKTIFGDLANMLQIRMFRCYRHQRFTTDGYGFRNPATYTRESYFPVVVLGDSDMAGSSLTDDDTFSCQLSRKLHVPVYNYAPGSLIAFLADTRFEEAPPKVVVWEALEHTIVGHGYAVYKSISAQARIVVPQREGPLQPQRKKAPRLSSFAARLLYHEFLWVVAGYHNPSVVVSDQRPGMLFYRDAIQVLSQGAEERRLETICTAIERAGKLCAVRGLTLVYMPLPNKETVYHADLPQAERNQLHHRYAFLERLHAELDRRGVLNVRLYEEFDCRAQGGRLLYHADDTHWNRDGVAAAVEVTAAFINETGLLEMSNGVKK